MMRYLLDKARSKLVLLAVAAGLGLLVCLLAVPALAASFSDVYSDTWDNADYPEAVGALSDLGVISGYSDGTFRPHNTVIRQQFAKMIVKVLNLPVTGNEVCPFTDVGEDTASLDPFYPDKYVAVAAAHGITKGKTATLFRPHDTITRAQVLSMVVRGAQNAGVALVPPSEAYYAGTITNSTFRNLKDPVHALNIQTAEMNNLVWGIWPDTGTKWAVTKEATRGEVALILWRLWQKMNPTTTTTSEETTTTTSEETTTTTTEAATTTTTTQATTTTTSPGGSTTTTTLPAANYWRELKPAGATPSARRATMVYLADSGSVIMFGGRSADEGALSDAWRYDTAANSWTELTPSGTQLTGRWGSAAVYDPLRAKVIVFGGYAADYLNDTWEYDPAADSWTKLQSQGRLPEARHGHAMVYDSARDKVLMFGGYDGNYLNDLWEYDPAARSWTELTPVGSLPGARHSHTMFYDPLSGGPVLFGGQLSSGTTNDMWEYDASTNKWMKVYPSGSAPSARAAHVVTYDPATARAIVFGGRAGAFFNDCWAYSPATETWTELHPKLTAPSGRSYAVMVYDMARGRALLFGGADSNGVYLGDIWEYVP